MQAEELTLKVNELTLHHDDDENHTMEDMSKIEKTIQDDQGRVLKEVRECIEGVKSQTGIIYDERMLLYQCSLEHPEQPARIQQIYQKLCDKDLVKRCKIVEPRIATTEELLTKHTIEHINLINSLKDRDEEELEKLALGYDGVYFHHNLSEGAQLSAGCTIALMEEVITGKLLNGVAVVRPPGHHALNHCSMGFCHFNNVAVATMVAIERYNLSRILIVDWDVHYGNGTHKMFESDPRVLFFSMHRYDHGKFWPYIKEANHESIGIDEAKGFNIHVAWNRGKMGDAEYLLAFEKILLPVAQEFTPELVIVSCGFDSGDGDPLGRCKVTPVGYAHMTRQLMDLADGKLILVLEGGYNLNTISNSMASCVSALLKDKLPQLTTNDPDYEGVVCVKNTFFVIQRYWQCLMDEDLAYFENYMKENESTLSSDDETEDLIDTPSNL